MEFAAPPRNPNRARDAIHHGFAAPANAFGLTHQRTKSWNVLCPPRFKQVFVWTQLETRERALTNT
eukprot:14105445-Heterocapsa_arctica.AAC.1